MWPEPAHFAGGQEAASVPHPAGSGVPGSPASAASCTHRGGARSQARSGSRDAGEAPWMGRVLSLRPSRRQGLRTGCPPSSAFCARREHGPESCISPSLVALSWLLCTLGASVSSSVKWVVLINRMGCHSGGARCWRPAEVVYLSPVWGCRQWTEQREGTEPPSDHLQRSEKTQGPAKVGLLALCWAKTGHRETPNLPPAPVWGHPLPRCF